jgi:hypothetical protein
MKLSSVLPMPDKHKMLELQTRLIDDPSMPDDFEVEMESESSPPIPVLYVKDKTPKPVVKIMPMRNGRYRVFDPDSNDDYYFDANYKESQAGPMSLDLHARVMACVDRRAARTRDSLRRP